MPAFTVQDIVRATQGTLVAGDLGVPITGVSIDSRSLGVGEWVRPAVRLLRLKMHSHLSGPVPVYFIEAVRGSFSEIAHQAEICGWSSIR